MAAFANLILRLRGLILTAAALSTLMLAYSLMSLHQDQDVLKFLPAEDPDIQLFRKVSAEFGGLDVAIVGVESEDLLTARGLETVRRMTRALGRINGVHQALAFTEIPHLRSTEEEFSIDMLVPLAIPNDPQQIEAIRRQVLDDSFVRGRLVSLDGQAAMIVCFLAAQWGQEGVADAIREVVERERGSMQVYYGGLPFVQSHIGGGARRDIIRLTPYVLLVAALATFLFFRRPLGALLVLASVGLSTVWTIGGMAAMGASMTIISTSLPMVLVAVGGAYGAHILAAFYVARAPTAAERAVMAMEEAGPPVMASILTTIAAFASFLAMDVAPMRAFGLQAAAGVFLCGVNAFLVIPCVLSYSRGKPLAVPAERLAGPIWWLCRGAHNRRWVTLGVAVGLSLFAGSMAWRVAPDTSLDSFFRPDSGPAMAERFLRERFGGSVFVQVYLRGDLRDPVVLDEFRKIVEEARTVEGVTDVNSFLETLVMLASGLGGAPRLPQTPEQVIILKPFMAGNLALQQLVDDELTRAVVQITVGTQDTKVVGQVVDRLSQFMNEQIPRSLVPVDIRGEGPQVEAARSSRLQSVAARIVRLLRASGESPGPQAVSEVRKALDRQFGNWTLAPGPDLEEAMGEMGRGLFQSDDSPFAPFDGRMVGRELSSLAQEPVSEERLAAVLPSVLPSGPASDEEGVESAVPVLADRIRDVRAEVLARRLLPDVLAAAGVPQVGGRGVEQVRLAIEELDDARVGLPADGPEALKIEIGVTGTPVINRAFGRSTGRNQIGSMIVSILCLFLLGSSMFRSWRMGLLVLSPACFTLLVTFGLMGWLTMPLDPGTAMVAALSLGIGIDYAIHFLWRRRWRGLSLEETSRTVGPYIVFNAVEVASGFAVMILSYTVPLSRFGILVSVSMVVAVLATLTLLPALEHFRDP